MLVTLAQILQKSRNKSNVFCNVLSQHLAAVMDGLAKKFLPKSSNVSISGRSGAEKLKAEAEEAIKALDSNKNNKQVIVNIVINGASIFDVNHKGEV